MFRIADAPGARLEQWEHDLLLYTPSGPAVTRLTEHGLVDELAAQRVVAPVQTARVSVVAVYGISTLAAVCSRDPGPSPQGSNTNYLVSVINCLGRNQPARTTA